MPAKPFAWFPPKDPGHHALRRALRVALITPLVLLLISNLPLISDGATMGAFACLALMIFADFGGPRGQRFMSYAGATAAAVPILIIGAFAGQAILSAAITAFLVALLIGLLGVLRGRVAASQKVLLLALVLALTSSSPQTVWADVAGWVIGGLITAVGCVILWPEQVHRPLREQLAEVLDDLADAGEARWLHGGTKEDVAAADADVKEALAKLHKMYDGNLLRPSGFTLPDRAVAELVDEVGRLRYTQKWIGKEVDRVPELDGMVRNECQVLSQTLRACAERLRGDSDDPLSSAPLFEVRKINVDTMADWLARNRESQPPEFLREQIEDTFPLRICTLVAIRITDLTIAADPRPGDTLVEPEEAPGLAGDAMPTSWDRLQAQLSWDSPWFRQAVRTAIALGISVGVAETVSLQHPFWITLGTISAMRFDALGTGRTVLQGFIGTAIGVTVSAALVLTLGTDTPLWWMLLPLTLFLAAYTPGVASFITGQACFTLTVIALFAVVASPTMALAKSRLIDVTLGLLIGLFVSLLMWPRGVIETLLARMRLAMQASSDFYVASTDWLAGGAVNDRLLAHFRKRSADALDRAQESLDLSIAQRPPEPLTLHRWTAMANTIRHVDFCARLMPSAKYTITSRDGTPTVPAPLVGPLLTGSDDVRDNLNAAAQTWSDNQPADHQDQPVTTEILDLQTSAAITELRHSVDDFLAHSSTWNGHGSDPRPVIVTWLADWTALFDRDAARLTEPV